MGSFSIWHWLVVIVVIMLLFGRGKISELMGDVAKGVKSFKKGLADDDDDQEAKAIENESSPVANKVAEEKSAGIVISKALYCCPPLISNCL